MATYVFENMTQDQANTLTTNDVVAFSTQSVTASNLTVTPPGAADTISTVKLTVGTKTLSFDASNLATVSAKGNLAFFDGSSLHIGSNSTTVGDTGGTLFQGSTNNNAADVIYGFDGADSILGGNGADNIFGGLGADTINGEDGADHLYGFQLTGDGTSDAGDVISGGNGNDYINGMAGDDTINGDAGSDRLRGGGGADTINGGEGNDTINGEKGNDTINGDNGNDSIRGGQGNDQLFGGNGSDILVGDLGADTLTGGNGVDFLTGGDGADQFTFAAGEAALATTSVNGVTTVTGVETIFDFQDTVDKIKLDAGITISSTSVLYAGSGATFTSVLDAQVQASALIGSNAATKVAVIKIGSDSYLFSGTGATDVIKLQGIADPTLINSLDFA